MPRILTTEDAWAVWLETHSKHVAPRTLEEYRSVYRLVPKGRPSLADLEIWRAGLARDYALSHANHVTAVLRAVVRRAAVAEGDGELGAIVMALQPLREPELPQRCPPLDLLDRAILLAENPAQRAWLRLAGDAGLRVNELKGLRPEDNNRAMLLDVVRQRGRDCRKNYRTHAVELDEDLYADVRWTIANREEMASNAQMDLVRAGWLFPWSTRYLRHFSDRIRAALPGYLPRGTCWHGFRHLGATRLALAGASVTDIQEWLGDRDPTMASRYVASVRGSTRAKCLTREPRLCQRAEKVDPERMVRPGSQPSLHTTLSLAADVEWGPTAEVLK